jgi:hypothetical protein
MEVVPAGGDRGDEGWKGWLKPTYPGVHAFFGSPVRFCPRPGFPGANRARCHPPGPPFRFLGAQP